MSPVISSDEPKLLKVDSLLNQKFLDSEKHILDRQEAGVQLPLLQQQ